MKRIKYILAIIAVPACCLSCKKEFNNVKTAPISAVTVVNAVVNAAPLISDFSGADSVAAFYSTTIQIGYGSFYEYSLPSSQTPAEIYQLSDTTNPFYKKTINLQPDAVYSLFLSGADTNHIDTLLIRDNPPYHSSTDSTAGIRFINLSTGSSPMSVNIQGDPNGQKVGSLSYQAITNFKNYPATQDITQYNFEIRDAASGNLLATYTYNVAPFQNVTIAVIGSEDPSLNVPVSVIQINNF